MLDRIVNDSIYYSVLSDENRWANNGYAYNKIMDDSSLYNIPDYKYFADSLDAETSGIFRRIAQAVNDEDYALASTYLNLITDTFTVVVNMKTVTEIYLRTLAVGLPLDSHDKSTLLGIATQVSMVGGEGVFWARSILGIEYEDILSGLLRQGQSLPENNSGVISVTPNPTQHKSLIKANFNIDKVVVYNYVGNRAEPIINKLDTNTYEINFSNMSAGFYFAKIIGEEEAFIKIIFIK